jgi:hypothetical protein
VSRNGHAFKQWPSLKQEIARALRCRSAVLEGEIACLGRAPVRLQYVFKRGSEECQTLKPMLMRWLSGAEASVSSLVACSQSGRNQQFSFMRPTGVPGVEVDVTYAVELERMKQQRAQALALKVGALNFAPLEFKPIELQRRMHCVSRVVGSTIYTDCR